MLFEVHLHPNILSNPPSPLRSRTHNFPLIRLLTKFVNKAQYGSLYVLLLLLLMTGAHAAMTLPKTEQQTSACPGFCFRKRKTAKRARLGLNHCKVRRCVKTNASGDVVRGATSCQNGRARPSPTPTAPLSVGTPATVFEEEVKIPAGQTESQPPTTTTDGDVPFIVSYNVKVAPQGLVDISNVTYEINLVQYLRRYRCQRHGPTFSSH